jgi:hypothetical protein
MAEDKLLDSDKLLAELLLRVSTVEKLLIDKKIVSLDEYNEIFTKSVNKLMDLLKNPAETSEVTPPGILKN